MNSRANGEYGFTVIEVIVVLIILGIIAAVFLNRMTENRAKVLGQAEVIRSHLRYTQTLAMNSDKASPGVWGIVFERDNNRYWLFYCDNPDNCDSGSAANRRILSGSDPRADKTVYLSDVQITLNNGAIVAFDTFGRPYSDAHLQNPLSQDLQMSISDAASNSETINITPETGFMQ